MKYFVSQALRTWLIFGAVASMSISCSNASKDLNRQIPAKAEKVQLDIYENDVPGTVRDTYVEEMADYHQQPGQIYGVTYRPAHTTLAVTPPGRYQQVEYPDQNRDSTNEALGQGR